MIDNVQVTAIKQGLVLRNKPVAASIINRKTIEERGISQLHDLSELVPNFYMPDYGSRITSSIYVRGLGARIDQPVVGLNVDNVPMLSKDNYDFEMADIERIEVLRGPQSTLYGRNTMGGVINIYTLSPLSFQGTKIGVEYGSANSWNVRASTHHKLAPNFGVAASGYFAHSDGFFKNIATDEEVDWENIGGGRLKIQWRGKRGLYVDNTLSFSVLEQGGYAYAKMGTGGLMSNGEINYNDPSSFDRTNISYGLTLRKEHDNFAFSSIASYHYTDNELNIDNDFTSDSYFTLSQRVKEHNITEDIVFRSISESPYQWLFGAFGFFKNTKMAAPVTFKEDGIQNLIVDNLNRDPARVYEWLDDTLVLGSDFRTPNLGFALYHQSEYNLGRWNFSAGIRLDYEYSQLIYNNYADADYKVMLGENTYEHNLIIDNNEKLNQSFIEVLPKVSALYKVNDLSSFYASISRGYKAGGFNTQMFSDVLQQQLMNKIVGISSPYDAADIVTYKPEQSWNYEVGGNVWWRDAGIRADVALFYIDCYNQQLTVFPKDVMTGRMMTNAGRSRSFGAELSINANITQKLNFTANYGYTNAKFTDYNDGKSDYKGKYVPYAPQQTLSARLRYSISVNKTWLENIVLSGGMKGVGRIYWNEDNTITQPFYTLFDCSIRLENEKYSLDLWGRNLTNTNYDTFYFKSIGNSFTQKGRPQTFGITLNINL